MRARVWTALGLHERRLGTMFGSIRSEPHTINLQQDNCSEIIEAS
jgi:hypothetical protein